MRKLILVLAAAAAAAAGPAARAATPSAICAAYAQKWASVSAGEDLGAMRAVADKIPADCPAHAAAQHRLAHAKSAEGGSQRKDQGGGSADDAAWAIARDAATPGAYGAYLTRYPHGRHAAEARAGRAGRGGAAEPAPDAGVGFTPPAPAGGFDARNPGSLLAVLRANGSTGVLKLDSKGAPYIDAKSGSLTYVVDFFGCTADHGTCKTLMYTKAFKMSGVTVDHTVRWNRWRTFCPTYIDADGDPTVWLGMRMFASQTDADVRAVDDIWQACLTDFDKFTDGPDAFLKTKGY